MAPKNLAEFYPLSPMQQGMLFHSLYAPESGVYVEQLTCTLCGALDVGAFEHAWQQVIDRHPILRTAFVGEGLKEPVQVVAKHVALPMTYQDWRALRPDEQALRLEALIEIAQSRGFTLSEAPLLRLALLRVADDTFRFVWTYHHALLDGWSGPLLLQEVFAFYEAFRQGQTLELPPRRPYRDYIAWLRRQNLATAEAFWRRTLAGLTAPTLIGVARVGAGIDLTSPGPGQEVNTGDQEIHLSRSTTQALRTFARGHQLTMNTLVQGAWALLLSRYSGEDDVLFGATVSGRPVDLPGAEEMIGLFINTLPVRVATPPDAQLIPWLQALQAQQAELRQYEYTPLAQIQGWSEAPRGTPLFETILVFENYPIGETLREQADSLEISDVSSLEQTNYPITLVCSPGDQLSLKIAYDQRRFDADTVNRLLGSLTTLLEGMAADPDSRLAELPVLTATEQRRLLIEWNDTTTDLPADVCVHQLFEAQVERSPNAIALTFGDQQLTYAELNTCANQLAHYLRRRGVGPEALVGICVERSPEMIVGLLGVLKAGGAYIPLDPSYPAERLRFMLEDAQPVVLLTIYDLQFTIYDGKDNDHNTHETIVNLKSKIVNIEADWAQIAREPGDNLECNATADNLAYVIYTSGSTGRPKGVTLQHRGLCNFALAQSRDMGVGPDARVLQFASFSFDAAVAETFTTLLRGGTLCLADQATLQSPADLVRLLREQAITTVTLPPSLLAVLPENDLPALTTVISAGESCPVEIAARWSRGRRFFNAYGPTETTVGPCWHEVTHIAEDETVVPIGRPTANTQIYLLDHLMRPVPIGVPGELYVGGIGIARGYLNRPELTAERFIDCGLWIVDCGREAPIHSLKSTIQNRVYKTGDLARYRPDGVIEFLGRVDHQVKLRGFRIELGEIEHALAQHPAVQSAVALVREDTPGEQRLVAYIVPTEDGGRRTDDDRRPTTDDRRPTTDDRRPTTDDRRPTTDGSPSPDSRPPTPDLRSFLAQRLPEHMLPSAFVSLDTWPMTPNGKIDRRALPKPDGVRAATQEYCAPRDTLEAQLAAIWEEILDVRPVGVYDNFFALGGHSLIAVRLLAQIQQRLGATLALVTLFQEPTVAGLAAALRQKDNQSVASALVPLQHAGSRRPLFLIHPSGGSVHWYTELSRLLGDEQPVYGLQARGIDGQEELHTSIEAMAAYSVAALRSVQPEGPYLIGGWSLGVVLAYEVAQQLQAAGQPVDLLALFDQGPQLTEAEPEDEAAFLLDVFDWQLPLELATLRQLTPDERLAAVLREARRRDMVPPDITLSQFRRFIEMLYTHNRAWRNYTPQPYDGRITLFVADTMIEHGEQPQSDAEGGLRGRLRGAGNALTRLLTGYSPRATRRRDDAPEAPDLGWGTLASAGVEIHHVPGHHRSMLSEPHVRVLAEQLSDCLERAGSRQHSAVSRQLADVGEVSRTSEAK
jgi:amino acid adenylation domain-containing protein